MVKNMTLGSDCLGSDATSAAPWMCGLTSLTSRSFSFLVCKMWTVMVMTLEI